MTDPDVQAVDPVPLAGWLEANVGELVGSPGTELEFAL